MIRGNNRRTLFYDDKDRQRFLARLKDMAEEFRDRILTLYEQLTQKRTKQEDVSLRREGRWLAVEEIVGICCRHLGEEPSVIGERQRKSWVRAYSIPFFSSEISSN